MTKTKEIPGGRIIQLPLKSYKEVILYLKKDAQYMKDTYSKLSKHEKEKLIYREKVLHIGGRGEGPWPIGEHLIYGRLDKNGTIFSPKVLIPLELTIEIIKQVHEDIQHGGRNKTYDRVR